MSEHLSQERRQTVSSNRWEQRALRRSSVISTWGLIWAAFLGSTMRTCSKCLRVCCLSFCSARTYFFSRLKTWRGCKWQWGDRELFMRRGIFKGKTSQEVFLIRNSSKERQELKHNFNDWLCCWKAVYPGWVLLQSSQVALQSQAAAVVKQSLNTGHVGLHQLLTLAGRLLLQRLHLLLETLHGHTQLHKRNQINGKKVEPCSNVRFHARLTWITAFLSERGRFLASLSASSHSLITWTQTEEGKYSLNLIVGFLFLSLSTPSRTSFYIYIYTLLLFKAVWKKIFFLCLVKLTTSQFLTHF